MVSVAKSETSISPPGQRIVVVRCEKINISGSFYRNKCKYMACECVGVAFECVGVACECVSRTSNLEYVK